MARKTAKYKVEDEGRDFGKVFLMTEMPATQGERWALRAMLAMSRHGVDIPDNVMQAGFAGMASFGMTLLGKIPFDEAEVLMDEMFQCISIIPEPSNPAITRGLVEDDIEEIATRVKLRIAVFKLHVDFSKAAALSTSALGAEAKRGASSNT